MMADRIPAGTGGHSGSLRAAPAGEDRGRFHDYRVKPGSVRFNYGYLVFLTVITLFGLVAARPRVLFVVLLMYLAWRWYEMLRTPTGIRVWADGTVEFLSRVRSVELGPGEIKLIRRGWRGYWLQHDRGAVALYGAIDGFDDLIQDLSAANPEMRVGVGTRSES